MLIFNVKSVKLKHIAGLFVCCERGIVKTRGLPKLKDIRNKLSEYKPILQDQFKVKEIGVFGSYVRSHLGIFVDFYEPISLLKFISLENHLSKYLGVKVDLDMKDAQLLPSMKPRPSLLYHYCPIEAFKSIINNGCMRLSDATHMNDSFEGKMLEHIVERHNLRSGTPGGACHSYHDYKLFKKTFFIACFSECGDLLSQWRAYADDGRGVSIGFNINDLPMPTGLTFNNVFHRKSVCTVDRVVYSEEAQVESLQWAFKHIDLWTRRALYNPSIYFHDAMIDTGRDCFAYISRVFKHPGFSEEHEWRIVYDGSDCKIMGIDNNALTHRIRDTNINYFEFNFRSMRQPICDVILGPKCTISLKDAQQLFKNNSYQGVEVRKSTVPYR